MIGGRFSGRRGRKDRPIHTVFHKAGKLTPSEPVMSLWGVYASRKQRERVGGVVMNDPRMKEMFDAKPRHCRLTASGRSRVGSRRF
jgi:uncharacterized protein YbaA (DUF1428 family)